MQIFIYLNKCVYIDRNNVYHVVFFSFLFDVTFYVYRLDPAWLEIHLMT